MDVSTDNTEHRLTVIKQFLKTSSYLTSAAAINSTSRSAACAEEDAVSTMVFRECDISRMSSGRRSGGENSVSVSVDGAKRVLRTAADMLARGSFYSTGEFECTWDWVCVVALVWCILFQQLTTEYNMLSPRICNSLLCLLF